MRQVFGNLRGKLLALLISALAVSFTVAAIAISVFVGNFHAEAMGERFRVAVESLRNELHGDVARFERGMKSIGKDAGVVASLNLLSQYADKDGNMHQVFDAEKRKLATDLRRLIDIDDDSHLLLLDAGSRLLSMIFIKDGDLVEAYAGAKMAPGKILLRKEDQWNPGTLPILLEGLPPVQKASEFRVEWHRVKGRLVVRLMSPVYKSIEGAQPLLVGFVALVHEFTPEFIRSVSLRGGTDFAIHTQERTLPALGESAAADARAIPELLSAGFTPGDGWRHTKELFASVSRVSLSDGASAYFVFTTGTGMLRSQVGRALLAIFGVLFVSTVLVTYLGHVMAVRWISRPVDLLVSNIDAVKQGQYQGLRQQQQKSDEFGQLSKALVEMAQTVQQRERQILELNVDLERRVQERTVELSSTNEKLNQSVEELRRTQSQLVQNEKMAALGGLVAGVAHEINTPIGISVTAASHLNESVRTLTSSYETDNVTRQDLVDFLQTARDSTSMVLSNLKRAGDLIRSFKQVAVDQTGGELRRFKLKDYLKEILHSLSPQLGKTAHWVTVDCADELEIYSDPGGLAQVITNLVINSLTHGFEGIAAGHIRIEAQEQGDDLALRYSDDGRGIAPEHLPRIFDPFFTTKRGHGGSGLGLHVAYNIVTQGLGGTIRCTSAPGEGVEFEIRIPLQREQSISSVVPAN